MKRQVQVSENNHLYLQIFFVFQRIHCSRLYLATVHKCYFSGLIPDAAAGCAGVDVEEVKEGST